MTHFTHLPSQSAPEASFEAQRSTSSLEGTIGNLRKPIYDKRPAPFNMLTAKKDSTTSGGEVPAAEPHHGFGGPEGPAQVDCKKHSCRIRPATTCTLRDRTLRRVRLLQYSY